ncbi:hypothetical protein GCM10027280_57490 [Micromonospora polyrhachis]|uniref:Uncharacterized protein n=1 Tax=Micromonospora polyrhachis TaxID=1282883 RepID=A0A7W7SUZ2_9ACTN|nr:holin [Micromonospora polyrhachis]MBB4961419.1 hypothetical protein [Micromonospora polyrhachis]
MPSASVGAVAENAPVEAKVKVATVAGAGSAGVIAPFIVWVVDQLFYAGDGPPEVPLPVVGLIGLIVTGVGTFLGGWSARHTPRPPD